MLLGGTGTGKSTLVNRLLGGKVAAPSFRRTFTAGCVAVARDAASVPAGWLAKPHVVAAPQEIPPRGKPDAVVVVPAPPTLAHGDLLESITLVDVPDLDGDQPAHHVQAELAFHWANAVIFLVTPEKQKLPEPRPFHELARRYRVPSLFVMNKCRSPAELDAYRQTADDASIDGDPPALFAVPRDGSAYSPPAGFDLAAPRSALGSLSPPVAGEHARRARRTCWPAWGRTCSPRCGT